MPVKNRNMVTAPKKRLVGKQPHLLAYITPAEAALLKKNGGTGEMVDGIPAFRPVKWDDLTWKIKSRALLFLVAVAAAVLAAGAIQPTVIPALTLAAARGQPRL
jgi:hypothetical protein